MGSVSTRLDEETEDEIRETADERDASIAAVVRELIEKGMDHDRLKTENERLKMEKRKLIAQMESNQELVKHVSEDRQLFKDEKARRNAPLWKKFYWAAFGRGDQNMFNNDDD